MAKLHEVDGYEVWGTEEDCENLRAYLDHDATAIELFMDSSDVDVDGASTKLAQFLALRSNISSVLLNADHCNDQDRAVTIVASALAHNTSVTELDLSERSAGGYAYDDCANPDCDACIDGREGGHYHWSPARAIGQMLAVNSTITSLALCGCDMDEVDACEISAGLDKNATLLSLDLDCNDNIGCGGAERLALELEYNRTLLVLGLRGCAIGDVVWSIWRGPCKTTARSSTSTCLSITLANGALPDCRVR